jgi:hypothetical protein
VKIHDYRKEKSGFGHDLAAVSLRDDGKIIKASGWGKGIKKGDAFLISFARHDTWSTYKVVEINYYKNPKDMFKVKLEFWPTLIGKKKEEVEKVIGGTIACV